MNSDEKVIAGGTIFIGLLLGRIQKASNKRAIKYGLQ
jgi:hypothetical protein